MKLKEEEQRAVRYLETRKGCDSVSVVSLGSISMYKLIHSSRVRNCAFLLANATKNFGLATRISQLVARGRLTIIAGHDNYTNNNFDFQPNRFK